MKWFAFALISYAALAFHSPVTLAGADSQLVRWTGSTDDRSDWIHLRRQLSLRTGYEFADSDFLLQESRDLAFTHYERYAQIKSGDLIEGKSVRIWTDRSTGKLVQIEAALDVPGKMETLSERVVLDFERLSPKATQKIAQRLIQKQRDSAVQAYDWKDRWKSGRFVRIVTIKGKRGTTSIEIHHRTKKVLAVDYREFPQADNKADETQTLDARVFEIYEEPENLSARLETVPAQLKYIYTEIPEVRGDLYAPLRTRRYFSELYSPVLGATESGRAQGYWAMSFIKQQAAQLRAGLPKRANQFSEGLVLQGKYATINIHPDAFKAWTGIQFAPKLSDALLTNWISVGDRWEMIPSQAFLGKPIRSATEAMERPARRLSDHDPVTYLNDGFDELQVYYAINVMFEQLIANGFVDPELSTRPFHAFLFNPDIEYRDNAYYTDDTINFTTYSAQAPNYARDNSTIWHELGHGVMDRLMGDQAVLADTGGLAEGMADLVAALIIQGVKKGEPFAGSDSFRIVNQTGFHLTNESHDDGEAYGGAMKDLMDAAVLADKENGLKKVTDLFLEGMRLTRDHPALTANEWFSHLLFADELGRTGLRAPGELRKLIIAALNGRNFALEAGTGGGANPVADMSLVYVEKGHEVTSVAEGSRYKQVKLALAPNETATLTAQVKLKSAPTYAFQYPVRIEVEFKTGALQGAVAWVGEERGPWVYELQNENETVQIPLQVKGTCDAVNREGDSCSDYAYIKVFHRGDSKPAAKKRFYVWVEPKKVPLDSKRPKK